jgi:hypothetical protein
MRPPLLATLLLLPLAILEVTQRRAYQEGFPWALFALLWLLAVAAVAGSSSRPAVAALAFCLARLSPEELRGPAPRRSITTALNRVPMVS